MLSINHVQQELSKLKSRTFSFTYFLHPYYLHFVVVESLQRLIKINRLRTIKGRAKRN